MKSAFIPKGRQTLQRLPWTTRYVEEEQIPRLSKGKNRWRDLITPPPIPRYVVVLVAAHFFSFFTPRLGLFYSSLSLSPLLSFSLEIIPRSRTSVESGGRLNSFIRPTTPLYPATYYWPLWAAGFSLLFFFLKSCSTATNVMGRRNAVDNSPTNAAGALVSGGTTRHDLLLPFFFLFFLFLLCQILFHIIQIITPRPAYPLEFRPGSNLPWLLSRPPWAVYDTPHTPPSYNTRPSTSPRSGTGCCRCCCCCQGREKTVRIE